jgi:hypothetical protein
MSLKGGPAKEGALSFAHLKQPGDSPQDVAIVVLTHSHSTRFVRPALRFYGVQLGCYSEP